MTDKAFRDLSARATVLLGNADLRIQVVRREINQGALAGLGSEISDYAAALVVAALDGVDEHLRNREVQRLARELADARDENETLKATLAEVRADLTDARIALDGESR
jgi:hypothetical protein